MSLFDCLTVNQDFLTPELSCKNQQHLSSFSFFIQFIEKDPGINFPTLTQSIVVVIVTPAF